MHPAWNKSSREHSLIGSKPQSLREEADAAVQSLGWSKPYFVDADHIGLKTVDSFLPFCDFLRSVSPTIVRSGPQTRPSAILSKNIQASLEPTFCLTSNFPWNSQGRTLKKRL